MCSHGSPAREARYQNWRPTIINLRRQLSQLADFQRLEWRGRRVAALRNKCLLNATLRSAPIDHDGAMMIACAPPSACGVRAKCSSAAEHPLLCRSRRRGTLSTSHSSAPQCAQASNGRAASDHFHTVGKTGSARTPEGRSLSLKFVELRRRLFFFRCLKVSHFNFP